MLVPAGLPLMVHSTVVGDADTTRRGRVWNSGRRVGSMRYVAPGGGLAIRNTDLASPELTRRAGPGTGLDATGVARKVEVVSAALRANDLVRTDLDPIRVLAAVGGFEIAFLAGVILGAASRRVPVLLDGFVTGAAALVATSMSRPAGDASIAATRSPEPGHALVLDRLRSRPLLDLELRLGEGSGAALALPIVGSTIAILNDMATFEAARVSRA